MNHRTIKILVSIGLIAGISSCNEESKPEQKTAPVQEMAAKEEGIKIDAAQLASNIDPVCGMSVSVEVADTTTYNGKIYGFCSTACKADFIKEPLKFVK